MKAALSLNLMQHYLMWTHYNKARNDYNIMEVEYEYINSHNSLITKYYVWIQESNIVALGGARKLKT